MNNTVVMKGSENSMAPYVMDRTENRVAPHVLGGKISSVGAIRDTNGGKNSLLEYGLW